MQNVFKMKKKPVNVLRREKKKKIDQLKNKTFKHEVNYIFNTFYRNQITELYREITKRK